jgi:hypothetical protein
MTGSEYDAMLDAVADVRSSTEQGTAGLRLTALADMLESALSEIRRASAIVVAWGGHIAELKTEVARLAEERDVLARHRHAVDAHGAAPAPTDDERHALEAHPDFEYATTEGPRKGFDEHPPSSDGWERNTAMGRDGWERFDEHEEAYWRRRKP